MISAISALKQFYHRKPPWDEKTRKEIKRRVVPGGGGFMDLRLCPKETGVKGRFEAS
jgi:hypothetical protein